MAIAGRGSMVRVKGSSRAVAAGEAGDRVLHLGVDELPEPDQVLPPAGFTRYVGVSRKGVVDQDHGRLARILPELLIAQLKAGIEIARFSGEILQLYVMNLLQFPIALKNLFLRNKSDRDRPNYGKDPRSVVDRPDCMR